MYAQQGVWSRHLVNLKNSVVVQEGGRVMTEKSPQFEVPCSTWLCSFGPGQRIWIEGGDQQDAVSVDGTVRLGLPGFSSWLEPNEPESTSDQPGAG